MQKYIPCPWAVVIDASVADALRIAWVATGRLCSKRLHPFLPELVRVLRRHGEITMTADMEAKLCQMSPSTIDRLLRPWRRLWWRRGITTTKPGSLLKNSILPIRTFVDWQEDCPGFLEVDVVYHCGDSTEGLYLTTLTTVDVATGWVMFFGPEGSWTPPRLPNIRFLFLICYYTSPLHHLIEPLNEDINGLILTKPYNSHDPTCNTILLLFTSAAKWGLTWKSVPLRSIHLSIVWLFA